ncbi:hypothetical protein Lepto7375DRAFT_7261 [Leptolyngbya sp. PCC 7375]|nr:hypothetical protein Lepto7375DRAFT_7261 [Leptolyngbya sp. PCC 7375]
MTKQEIIQKFLETAPENWDELISTLPGCSTMLIQQLDNELCSQIQTMAKLSGYFAARGAAGCGDAGHFRGLVSGDGKVTTIRRVLGTK